jgi:hypothetical protein
MGYSKLHLSFYRAASFSASALGLDHSVQRFILLLQLELLRARVLSLL